MTNVGMLLLSRSKWLNVDRVANVHKRVSLTKSEVREEGGLCGVFKEAVDKAAPILRAGTLACIRRPELFVRRRHSMDPSIPFQSLCLSR